MSNSLKTTFPHMVTAHTSVTKINNTMKHCVQMHLMGNSPPHPHSQPGSELLGKVLARQHCLEVDVNTAEESFQCSGPGAQLPSSSCKALVPAWPLWTSVSWSANRVILAPTSRGCWRVRRHRAREAFRRSMQQVRVLCRYYQIVQPPKMIRAGQQCVEAGPETVWEEKTNKGRPYKWKLTAQNAKQPEGMEHLYVRSI